MYKVLLFIIILLTSCAKQPTINLDSLNEMEGNLKLNVEYIGEQKMIWLSHSIVFKEGYDIKNDGEVFIRLNYMDDILISVNHALPNQMNENEFLTLRDYGIEYTETNYETLLETDQILVELYNKDKILDSQYIKINHE